MMSAPMTVPTTDPTPPDIDVPPRIGAAKDGKTSSVESSGLATLGPLASFAVSRDGTRIVVIAGLPGKRQPYLGRISSVPLGSGGSELMVDSWSRVPTSLADVTAVSWSGDLALTVLGTNTTAGANVGSARATYVALDGVADPVSLPPLPSLVVAAESAGAPVDLATAPRRPTVVCTGSRSWILTGRSWAPGPPIRDPTYP